MTASVTTDLPAGPALSAAETTFRWLAHPYAFLDECAAAYGDTFTLRFTRFGTHVVVTHPDDVRDVLSAGRDVLHAGRGNALLEPILGRHSLLVVDGDRHLAQRALVQPAFRTDRIARYAAFVVEATRRWTAGWGGEQSVSVQRTALEISKEVILRAVFGLDQDEIARFSGLVHEVMLLVGTNATFDAESEPSRVLQRFDAVRGALDAALQELIERRREAGGGDDVLSMLLSARTQDGAALSDEEIRDQLMTLVLAGHETTASSITWALVCLQAAPDARARLLQELDAVDEDAFERGLGALPYLQAVCLETLRMRPVIPVVSREVQHPFRLRDRLLPAGVFVTPCPYLAHRRPAVFADPEVFRPERFLEQRFSPSAYFPFGGGVRRCIGMSVALLEMQVVLGMVLRRFDFAVPDGAPLRAVRRGVTIVPSGGARMRVVPRAAGAAAACPW
jgi:unspecific monooxygenase